jgi:CHAT domain-containing protein
VVADLERRLQDTRAELDMIQRAPNPDISARSTNSEEWAPSNKWIGLPADIAAGSQWRTKLKVGEAALLFHLTDRWVIAFFVPDTGPVQMELLGPNVQQLHSLVQSYAEKLKDPRLPWKQTSTELYVELLSRFDHQIETLDHLFIVPSGFLYQVPFGTLYDTRSGKVLAERVAHSVLPHMALIELPHSIRASPIAVALGIRDFARYNTLSLGEDEAIAVRDTLGASTTLLLGSTKTATWKRLLEEMPGHQILHLSTHALPDRQPMLSAIVLKRPDGSDDSVSALDLLGTGMSHSPPLVTMSACDTGQVTPGLEDDILGLPRTFLLTGSVAVVTTLWPIQQESTRYLMKEFYRALKTPGVTVSSAMSLAQHYTAIRRDENWQHPYYWGALTVVGDGTIALFTRSDTR